MARPHDEPLRLTVTLPGSASLGALQAGAMAALAETISELQERGTEVRIDALGGSSAGSIVAMLFARGALFGTDVAELLRRAWVDDVDVDQLSADRSGAPLGMEQLSRSLRDVLLDEPVPGTRLADRLGLHVGLSNLNGLTYPVSTHGSAIEALSFADWGQFELTADAGVEQFVEPEGRSPLDFCLASASHPAAFPPRLLDRSADRSGYVGNSITNYPDSGAFWFTDGGLVESKPVGRVIAYARQRAGHAAEPRLHLVMDPRSSGPSGDPSWTDPTAPQGWIDGLRRAVSIVPTQALHDDLRAVATVNERIDRVDEAARTLRTHLGDDAVEALRSLLPDRDRAAEQPRDGGDGSEGVDELLRSVLRRVADVEHKERIDVEMVSPLELAGDGRGGVSDLLAGDFIGAFGGFLDHELRSSDFALGWCSFLHWLPGGLGRHGVTHQSIEAVQQRLEEHRFDISTDDVSTGGVSSLSWTNRLRLGRLAGRTARILVGESVGLGGSSRPDQDQSVGAAR